MCAKNDGNNQGSSAETCTKCSSDKICRNKSKPQDTQGAHSQVDEFNLIKVL